MQTYIESLNYEQAVYFDFIVDSLSLDRLSYRDKLSTIDSASYCIEYQLSYKTALHAIYRD